MPANPLRAFGALLVLVTAVASGIVIAAGFVAIEFVLDAITVWGYIAAVGVMCLCGAISFFVDLRGILEQEFLAGDHSTADVSGPNDGRRSSTGRFLPLQYTLLVFLIPALILPAFEVVTGGSPADPSLGELLVHPTVFVVIFNLAYYGRTRRGAGGVVDERDVRNINLALIATGVVLLGSIVGLYGWYAVDGATVPREIDVLAAIAVGTVLAVLGATEIRQRI